MNNCGVLRKGSGVVFGQNVFPVGALGINVVFRSAKARTFAERKTTLLVVARKRLPTPFATRATKLSPTLIVLPVLRIGKEITVGSSGERQGASLRFFGRSGTGG
jgi:hypothetical protein